MATIFEQISLDIQAHYLAWTGELDELRKKGTLTDEEKALLENRVHPIFKEISTAIGAFIMSNMLDYMIRDDIIDEAFSDFKKGIEAWKIGYQTNCYKGN
ncbi:hypothetical protein [Stenoxybacter acetivorans]|uniref:hypothetical protein n=1 Tax=Stenoxybacter acetivorans TaxID=422441 RepID=UPI000566F513|nr:hypothetical protein [Stenoxybacter acetivorans]